MLTKKSREELTALIIQLAKLPEGSSSDNYFTREQMEALVINLTEMNSTHERMASEIANLTEKILKLENGSDDTVQSS